MRPNQVKVIVYMKKPTSTRGSQMRRHGGSNFIGAVKVRVAITGIGLKAAQREVSTVTHIRFGANTRG